MLKNRIQYLLLLAFMATVYVFTNQYFVLLFLLLLLILPAFSFLLLVLSYRSITVNFEIPPLLKKSEESSIRFTVGNSSFFPASGAVLDILCRNALTGRELHAKSFCAIENQKTGSVSFTIADIHAGKITVILRGMKVCDILGLFSLSKKMLCEKSGLIYPQTYDVKIELENQAEINGDGERCSQTKRGQDVNELFALREYTPGDEMRKIHWKLSAKQNKLVVKDFGLSLNYPVFLLLEIFDTQTDKSDEALDACMTAFLSISRSLIDKGIRHNIAWYDSVGQKLIVKEIESADELEAYLADLLSMGSYQEDTFALKYYEMSNYRNIPLALYYITTKIDPEEVAKRACCQTVKTIYMSNGDSGDKTDTADTFVTTVTPQYIREELENIAI